MIINHHYNHNSDKIQDLSLFSLLIYQRPNLNQAKLHASLTLLPSINMYF